MPNPAPEAASAAASSTDAPNGLHRWVRHLDRASAGAVALVAAALVASIAGLVFLTGGTRDVFLHAMYLPVLLVAFRAGAGAGVATGLVGGMAIGPWMPLDVATGEAQQATSWVLRSGFFALVGGVTGTLARELRRRFDRVDALRTLVTQSYGASLRTLAGIASRRDDLGEGHAERVGHNAAAIGRRMGLDEFQVGRLYWAGLLHGLGRIDAEPSGEGHPGSLDARERAEVRAHAAAATDLLGSLTRAWSDPAHGSGPSPRAVAPLGTRIAVVADAFDALVAPRPYRPSLSADEARRLVVGGVGRLYDARVVAAFEAALADGALATEGTPPIDPAAEHYLTTLD